MTRLGAHEIARLLAERVEELVQHLLPAGRREGNEWRCGSVAGEAGKSLGVHLVGDKCGVWCDFATGQGGDLVDLVRCILGVDIAAAMVWARHWLRLAIPPRPASTAAAEPAPTDPDRWHRPWKAARPITGELPVIYLAARGLRFTDPRGDVLRFSSSHARKGPEGQLERHPALLALLRGRPHRGGMRDPFHFPAIRRPRPAA